MNFPKFPKLAYDHEGFLQSKGWRQTDVTPYSNHTQITWWRKLGREFPHHFALWMERTGAVKLLDTAIQS